MWVESMGVVVKRYIDILILLIQLLLYLFFFEAASLLFVHLKIKIIRFCFGNFCVFLMYFFAQCKHTYGQLRASHRSQMKVCI